MIISKTQFGRKEVKETNKQQRNTKENHKQKDGSIKIHPTAVNSSLRNNTRQVVHKPPTIERLGCLKGKNENSEDSKSFMKADTVRLHPELASYYLQAYFCVMARSLQGSWSQLLNLQVRATPLNLTDAPCA